MQTEEQKKQRKQLILVGIVVAVTIGVLFYSKKGKLTSTSKTATPTANVPVVSINAQLKSIEELDLSLLLENSFVDLEKIEGYPIDPGDIGRDNPFIPYE